VECGSPRAAILGRWRVQSDIQAAESTIQELIVLKLTEKNASQAGTVDACTPYANLVAQRLADEATR
jgi:hypothetical protein